VLAGRCDEELDMPYQPFVEALRFQVDLGDELPLAWLGPLAGELTRLVPELSGHLAGLPPRLSSDPESERARLFDAVTAWLHATTSSVPVMLVRDDLHWADRPTLQLMRHLVRETANDALLIVGTYRSTDLDRAHPLAATLADLRREGSVERLALDGLTGDGVADFLGGAAGHDLDEAGMALAQAVSTETGGNPFFVGEIVRHLVESGAPGAPRRPVGERPDPRRDRPARRGARGRGPTGVTTRRRDPAAAVGGRRDGLRVLPSGAGRGG